MIKRSTVFIPIISPKDDMESEYEPLDFVDGRLVEVYAESYHFGQDFSDVPVEEAAIRQKQLSYERKAIDKCWDRVSAPLRKNSPVLYQSGCVAANAIRKIRFKHPLCAFFQFFKPNAIIETKRLHSVTAWGPTEGRSAELGLALALAANMCKKNRSVILATGALSSSKEFKDSGLLFRADDIKVQPVGSLLEKLKLLLHEIQAGNFRELIANQELLVITPRFCKQAGKEQEVKKLAEVKSLNSLGVKVVPVDWLSEALTIMKADTTHYLVLDRVIQIMLGLIILLAVTVGSWMIWRDAEIPMAFTLVNPGNIEAEPFELCTSGQKHYALPIRKMSLVPTMPVTGIIGWRVIIGEQNSFDSSLATHFGFQGYFIAVMIVSEFSPTTFDYARVGNTTRPLRIIPGQSYEGWVKLNDRAEINALVILAQRHPQFDTNLLREQFQKRFHSANLSSVNNRRLDVDAATDFFETLAPGSLIFPFVSVMENSRCVH